MTYDYLKKNPRIPEKVKTALEQKTEIPKNTLPHEANVPEIKVNVPWGKEPQVNIHKYSVVQIGHKTNLVIYKNPQDAKITENLPAVIKTVKKHEPRFLPILQEAMDNALLKDIHIDPKHEK